MGFSAYTVENSSRPPVRIIVGDHFSYIEANQKWAAAAYYKVVEMEVRLLVDLIGEYAFLELFSYETDVNSFNNHAMRAMTTLCNSEVNFFVDPLFLLQL